MCLTDFSDIEIFLKGKELALKRVKFNNSYYEFFKYYWKTVIADDYVDNWHIKYLCDELQIVGDWVANGKSKEYDLVINIPPSESKSTICTVLFPVWLWTLNPSLVNITVSHSDSLVKDHATKSRDVISHEDFTEVYSEIVQIRKDIDNKSVYQTTKKGARISVSVGGNILGKHANLVILDDAANQKQVNSKTYIETVKYFVTKVLPTRVKDYKRVPFITIMQRLHEDDPTAWALKRGNTKHICLPADDSYPILPADELLEWNGEIKTIAEWYKWGGGVLNKFRRPPEVLEVIKRDLGSDAAGQLGQQPAPSGGEIVKKEWFRIVNVNQLGDLYETIMNNQQNVVIDSAYTEKQQNDPTGILRYTVVNDMLFLLDFQAVRYGAVDLLDYIKNKIDKYKRFDTKMYIEPKASGITLQQILLNDGYDFELFKMPSGDKVQRLNSVIQYISSGKVWIVNGLSDTDWNDFIRIVTMFPKVTHDEQVDCLTMAITQGLIRGHGWTGDADYN